MKTTKMLTLLSLAVTMSAISAQGKNDGTNKVNNVFTAPIPVHGKSYTLGKSFQDVLKIIPYTKKLPSDISIVVDKDYADLKFEEPALTDKANRINIGAGIAMAFQLVTVDTNILAADKKNFISVYAYKRGVLVQGTIVIVKSGNIWQVEYAKETSLTGIDGQVRTFHLHKDDPEDAI